MGRSTPDGTPSPHDAAKGEQARTPGSDAGERQNRDAGHAAGGEPSAASRVRNGLAQRIGREPYRRYFDDGSRVEVDRGTVHVRARDKFTADLIGRRFGTHLRGAAADAGCTPESGEPLRFDLDQTAPAEPAPVERNTPAAHERGDSKQATRPKRKNRSKRWLSFDQFIVGSSNRIAHGAALRLAEVGGDWIGPLFIHGGCGLGKTHLLEAVAERFCMCHPGARVKLTSGEAFVGAFVRAIRTSTMPAFQRAHRDIDLLCIDDIGVIGGKVKTQLELAHTLDVLRQSRARIVLASDAEPGSIEKIDDALRSRFSGGVVARLDTPEPALRRRIAGELCRRRGLPVTLGAANRIADSMPHDASVRDLEGMVTQVEAVWQLQRSNGKGAAQIGVVLVESALVSRRMNGPGPDAAQGPVAFEAIIGGVCARTGVEPGELSGRGRTRRVVFARSMVVLLAKKLTNRSYPEIARGMGRPNHSTVITQMRSIEKKIADGVVIALDCPLDGLTIPAAAETIERAIRADTGR